jgi:excisionase family DNA binding protein
MRLIPFTTQQAEMRIINSEIGKVVPVIDVAKAIGYDRQKLHEMIERNFELFSPTVVTVTVTTVQDNRGTMAEQKYNVKALNHYGVVGLLMKLDYNRIQSEEKKKTVIRFQKWAMRVLGDAMMTIQSGEKYLLEIPFPEADVNFITASEAAEILGRSYRTIRRYIKKGKLKRYKLLNGFLLDRDQVMQYKKLRDFKDRL